MKYLNIFLFLFIVVSCSNNNENGSSNQKQTDKLGNKSNNVASGNIDEDFLSEGKKIYRKYCLACHQIDGTGVSGTFPPIDNSDLVSNNKDSLISIVLSGIKGKVIVKGEEYNNIMPPHNFLNDEQVAQVSTYIRNNFGNTGEAVKTEEVIQIRKKVKQE